MANFRKIVKTFIPSKLFKEIEPFGHLVESILANIRYGFPSRGMHVIGVTGTNGKTTTTLLIQKMLVQSGYKAGVLSTVAVGEGNNIRNRTEHMTTDKASTLQKTLRDFKRAGVEWAVVEVSSHALAQNRVWGVLFEIAVLTNVTHDHLDYHGTFENYLETKRRLFKIAAKNGRKLGVVNSEDPNAGRFAISTPNTVLYGIGKGDITAEDIKMTTSYSEFTAKANEDSYKIRVNIPGEFNISNALAAIAVGREIGLDKEQIEQGIASLEGVTGRMYSVEAGQKFKVMVDFASTPDGFENFFTSIKPHVKGKLIAVFGSAGRRDKSKRALQGEIASKFADEIILTEEDDRDEDGQKILAQIASGVKKPKFKEGKNLHLILNREEAIGFALTRATKSDDMVVILGKGHEDTIERSDGEHPWSDIEVTRSAIEAINNN